MSSNKKRQTQLQDSEKYEIIGRVKAGQTRRKVAEIFNCSHSAVTRVMKRDREGEVERKTGTGKHCKLNAHDERRLVRITRQNERISYEQLRKEAGLEHIHRQTIRRYLHKHGFVKLHGKFKRTTSPENKQNGGRK